MPESRRSHRARTALAGALVAGLVLAGCESGPDGQDSAPSVSSSVLPPLQDGGSSTTSPATGPSAASPSATSSSSSTSSTTTSVAPAVLPGDELVLGQDALGTARFGAEAGAVIDYLRAVVGEPTADTAQIDPSRLGGCAAAATRAVSWNDLVLYFGGDTAGPSGRAQFLAYAFGPRSGETVLPSGLHTERGVGIGSDVATLAATYSRGNWTGPNAAGRYDVEIGPNFVVEVDGNELVNAVIAVRAGDGCTPAGG